MNTIKYVSVLATFGFLLLTGLTAQAAEGVNDQKAKAAEEDKLPRPAPDFTLKDSNGKEVQLSKLTEKGKIVVLEWFNYDCPFVKYHYTPKTNTTSNLAKKYKDKDVVWLIVNSTNYATAETNAAWAKEHEIKQTILIDSDGKVGRLYKAKTTPQLFVIDKAGKIVYDGAIDNAPRGKVPEGKEKVNYVDQALTEMLADKPVSTPKTKPYGCSVKYAKVAEPEKPA